MASFNHSWLSSPLSEPPTFFLSPSPQPKPFKLSVLRNKSSSILNSSSPDRSPEVEVVVDPVKLALKKAEAYKKSKAEQKTPERNTDDEEVPLTVKLAKQKADVYKKQKEVGADGVQEANKPSSAEQSSVRSSNKVDEENNGKKKELKVSSIDFVGLGFADKKSTRGLPPGLVPVEDYFPGGDLPEVEFIVGDKTRFDKTEKELDQEGNENSDVYKPKVSTWGVFPRPSNISKTFGGGRTLQPGDSVETAEERTAREERTKQLLTAYKESIGLNIDPKLKLECEEALAPFKFDAPSPDDLVSNGLKSSRTGSKDSMKKKEKQDSAEQNPLKKGADTSSQGRHDNVGGVQTFKSLPKAKADKSKETSSSSENMGASESLTGTMNNMSLTGEIETSRDVKIRSTRSKSNHKPEEWMMLDKESDTLSQLNLAIVGHVDSGKSTLSGRLLHLLGRISQKQMHKFEKEAKSQGKGSFAYAWALDESAEERERGITMTVAVAYFTSKRHHVVLLDSPGHKDFVPNMIAGATQADAAILVIDASIGAFEAGFDNLKGQTREHARVLRGFGVEQVIVAVNKMDIVGYSKERFELIKQHVGSFLHSCRFKESSLTWIPLSAVENQNLVAAPSESRLSSWYRGPCLLEAVDSVKSPERDVSKPLLMPICDVVRSSSGQVSACGKLEAGAVRPGSKVMVMPSGDQGTVRSLERDSRGCSVARAGDNVAIALQGIDANQVMAGGVLCHPDYPVSVATRLELMVLVLEGATPILLGSQLEFHVHHAKEAATVVKLVAMLDPKTGEATKTSPRCLTAKQSAMLEVSLQYPVCVETFSESRALGRVFLRSSGRTVAMGRVTRIIQDS